MNSVSFSGQLTHTDSSCKGLANSHGQSAPMKVSARWMGIAGSLMLPLKLADGDATRLDGVHRGGERGPRTAVMA